MVKVPTAFESGVGQRANVADQTPFQNMRATPNAFGAQQGRDLQQIGRAGQQAAFAYKRIQDEEDTAKAYEAYTLGSEENRAMLNDPEKGLYQRKGSDANGTYKDALKGLDDIYFSRTKDLTPGARGKFNQLWRNKRERTLESVSRFEVQKRNEFKQSAAEAAIKTSINDAVENYNNPQQIADSIELGESTIRETFKGQPQEAVDLRIEAYKTELHGSIIDRMVLDNPLAADQYYKKVKDQIGGKQQVVIEKTLEAGTQRAASQAATDQIVVKHESFEEQLIAARKIKDPIIRDKVVSRVKQRFNENQTITAERNKEISSKAWQTVLDTKSVDAIPINEWTALDGKTQKALTEYANRRNDPKTNILKWKELNDLYIGDPQAFGEVNLLEYVNDLSQSDFKAFSENQQKLQSGDFANNVKSRTHKQIADDRLNAIGINVNASAGSSDSIKSANFMRRLEEEMAVFAQDTGKEPNAQQIEQLVDKLLIKADTGIFSEKFAFELESGEDFEVDDIDDIPLAERRKIVQAIEATGAQATEENILKLINEKLRNDKK
jgi:hypothetical protein